jgi:hypothetical protein
MTFNVWIGDAAANLECFISYLKVFTETCNWPLNIIKITACWSITPW